MLASSAAKIPSEASLCLSPSWPQESRRADIASFADLQTLYFQEAPALLVAAPVLKSAELVAKSHAKVDFNKQAEAVTGATYLAQVELIDSVCGSIFLQSNTLFEKDTLSALLVEDTYARMLFHTNFRADPALAARFLPVPFSTNLTTRMGVVTLSIGCSSNTPYLNRLLTHFSVPCGLIRHSNSQSRQ